MYVTFTVKVFRKFNLKVRKSLSECYYFLQGRIFFKTAWQKLILSVIVNAYVKMCYKYNNWKPFWFDFLLYKNLIIYQLVKFFFLKLFKMGGEFPDTLYIPGKLRGFPAPQNDFCQFR